MTDEFGFKHLSSENWLTIDSAWRGTIMSNREGDQVAGWIAELDDLQLEQSVPIELRKLFSVARAALAYSPVYYPFLALGSEQALRVAEGAVSHKCKTLEAPRKAGKFIEKIDWLASKRVLDEDACRRWHCVRLLRNEGSHPKDQTILNPALALSTLEIVVELVNDLFAAGAPSLPEEIP